jgi:transcription initiation factor TFIIH subunit 4
LQAAGERDLHIMEDSILQSWEYLEKLQGIQFFKLYKQPASALAIFRKRLTNLAKSFVMTLLWSPVPMPSSTFDLLVKETHSKEKENALFLLQKYHIFKQVTYAGARSWSLTPEFARSLRIALTGGSKGNYFGQIKDISEEDEMPISELDNYARDRWEGILGFMVNSSEVLLEGEDAPRPPSQFVIQLLQGGGLIEVSGTASRGQTATVTKEGFAFVLQDINTQLWALLFLYVENAETLNMDSVDVLAFLFFISSLELGSAYSIASLDEIQQTMLTHLEELGIIFWPKSLIGDDRTNPEHWISEDYFFPTRLATSLTSDSDTTISSTNATLGSSLSSGSGANKGFIIIETNYRFYAYTSSPLQIALINLFVRVVSRHPNLVTGKLTKSSVARAIQAGITAEQIISYLSAHAHPQMRRHAQLEQARLQSRGAETNQKHSVLPATILDQIYLWHLERDRMTTTAGYLLKEFRDAGEYESVCRYADEIGVLVWKHDRKRMFFVTRVDGVRDFMQSRKNAAQATT